VLRDLSSAYASFVRATEIDPLNARAWSGISSVWAARTTSDQLPVSEGVARVAAAAERAVAIDSTEGRALANLGIVRALERRSLSAGMPLIRRAMAYEPSNAEIYLIAAFLDRHAHRGDESRDFIRLARQLDPLTRRYGENEGGLEMCAGRPAASEQVYRRALEEQPTSPEARDGLVRALAAQHRYDEALDVWRLGIGPSTPASVAAALRGAHGRQGYLAAWHADGKDKLAALLRATAGKRVPPLRLMDFQFSSGDTAAGFATLEASLREREPWTYRLPCLAALDEVRDSPHYRTLFAGIGVMSGP
jgi:Flp pilus assembly protein TadD